MFPFTYLFKKYFPAFYPFLGLRRKVSDGVFQLKNPSSTHFECFSLGKEYDKLEPLPTLISLSESSGRCILLAPPPFLPCIWCALAPHYLPLVSSSHRSLTPMAPSQWCSSSPFCSESTPTLSNYHHVLYTAFYFYVLFIFCLSCQNIRARQVAPFGLVCALIFPSIQCNVYRVVDGP